MPPRWLVKIMLIPPKPGAENTHRARYGQSTLGLADRAPGTAADDWAALDAAKPDGVAALAETDDEATAGIVAGSEAASASAATACSGVRISVLLELRRLDLTYPHDQ